MAQLTTEGARQRKNASHASSKPLTNGNVPANDDEHPVGPVQHGVPMQLLRIVGFGIYFFGSCLFIHGAQLLGLPLYFCSKDWFYAYMALTKQYFGLLVTVMTQWWSPTVVRVSGDKSMKGQLRQSEDGKLEVVFPERVVLMANHQIYTDWLYLWWVAYTNTPPMHGHIYIILKESLKYVPVIGPAMMLYGFVFMARKWASDQKRLRYRLQKLNSRHSGPMSGGEGGSTLDPMWLMIFPEGTNLSGNTRKQSAKWASKTNIEDCRNVVLPRSLGLQFCLQELRGTVEYLYDCTIAYEGIPLGQYGQDIFTLRSVYFQGRPPKSVNMHWRRFAVKDIPVDDDDKMHDWVMQRWREKDDLIETYIKNGKFQADNDAVSIAGGPQDSFKTPYINTSVQPKHPLDGLQMYLPVLGVALIGSILVRLFVRIFGA